MLVLHNLFDFCITESSCNLYEFCKQKHISGSIPPPFTTFVATVPFIAMDVLVGSYMLINDNSMLECTWSGYGLQMEASQSPLFRTPIVTLYVCKKLNSNVSMKGSLNRHAESTLITRMQKKLLAVAVVWSHVGRAYSIPEPISIEVVSASQPIYNHKSNNTLWLAINVYGQSSRQD